jgi:hypothetical protein
VTGAYIDWYLGQSTPYQYRIGVSADGSSFTTVVDQTARSALGGNSSHSFNATGRYVRLTVTGSGTTGRPAAVREFDVLLGTATVTNGLKGQYYDNKDFTALKVTRTDGTVNFDWGTGSPASGVGADTFSVRWTGQVQAPTSGTYTFTTASDDGVRLWVNGQLLVNNWTNHAATENSGTIVLTGGQKYSIKMEYYENGAVAKLLWSGPGISKQAVPKSRLFPQ